MNDLQNPHNNTTTWFNGWTALCCCGFKPQDGASMALLEYNKCQKKNFLKKKRLFMSRASHGPKPVPTLSVAKVANRDRNLLKTVVFPVETTHKHPRALINEGAAIRGVSRNYAKCCGIN